jgi:hypothetical protein
MAIGSFGNKTRQIRQLTGFQFCSWLWIDWTSGDNDATQLCPWAVKV